MDLDGTLLRGDTFWEQVFFLLRQRPLFALQFFGWALRGKRHTKERLAGLPLPPVESLPFSPAALEWLAAQRATGRRLELVTGTHRAAAQAAADRAGLFDAVHATTPETNLTSSRKAAFLRERHGTRGFDYAGNSGADLAVWREAHTAHVWHARPGIATRARSTGAEVHEHGLLPPTARTIWRQLRPQQWVKNVLVFLPLLLAHQVGDRTAWLASLLAFLCFCLSASGAYCLNDLFDLAADRAHAEKRTRPLAAGDLAPVAGVGLAIALPLLALALGWLLPWEFFAALALYFVATVAYSLSIKRVAGADVVMLTGLYTLRILAGGLATGIPVTQWLLGFAVFFFLSLSLLKRHGELLAQPGGAIPGRGYQPEDVHVVRAFGTASAYVSVLVLVLYMNGETVVKLYRHPAVIWLVGPLLLFWFHRLWLLSARGLIPGDPIPFVLRDRTSYGVAAATMVIVAAAALWK